MALNIKNAEVERLVADVAAMTGESKTEAVKRALIERRERLRLALPRRDRRADIMEFLEREIWSMIPPSALGGTTTKEEIEDILGYGAEGF